MALFSLDRKVTKQRPFCRIYERDCSYFSAGPVCSPLPILPGPPPRVELVGWGGANPWQTLQLSWAFCHFLHSFVLCESLVLPGKLGLRLKPLKGTPKCNLQGVSSVCAIPKGKMNLCKARFSFACFLSLGQRQGQDMQERDICHLH